MNVDGTENDAVQRVLDLQDVRLVLQTRFRIDVGAALQFQLDAFRDVFREQVYGGKIYVQEMLIFGVDAACSAIGNFRQPKHC